MSATFRHHEFEIVGSSSAGEESWFRVRPPGIALDVGRGAPTLSGVDELFITHGHLDHALGIPYLLSQRSLHHLPDTKIYCPTEIADNIATLIAASESLEGTQYRYEVIPMKVGATVQLSKDFRIEAFRTFHVVPSLGFHLWRRKSRLKRGYLARSAAELVAMKGRGVKIEEVVEELCISYCGDTGPEVFERNSQLFESRVLMVECTFIGSETRSTSGAYGHIHLEDLVEHSEKFRNEVIVLHHLSRRHSWHDLQTQVQNRLPDLAERIHVFGLTEGESL